MRKSPVGTRLRWGIRNRRIGEVFWVELRDHPNKSGDDVASGKHVIARLVRVIPDRHLKLLNLHNPRQAFNRAHDLWVYRKPFAQ